MVGVLKFPKTFQSQTIYNLNGYLRCRSRDTKLSFKVGNAEINNRRIVSYNPYLNLKINCHITVEVCTSMKSVKYLFKYVYKGHDCVNIEITESITHGKYVLYMMKLKCFWIHATPVLLKAPGIYLVRVCTIKAALFFA